MNTLEPSTPRTTSGCPNHSPIELTLMYIYKIKSRRATRTKKEISVDTFKKGGIIK